MPLEWHNRPHQLVGQYVKYDEIIDWRMKALLDKYGRFFNDEWYFRVGGKTLRIVERMPIEYGWRNPPTEKRKAFRKGRQIKLLLK